MAGMGAAPSPYSVYAANPGYGATYPEQIIEVEKGNVNALVADAYGRKRMKLNLLSICVSHFVPWLLFTALFGVVSFKLHFLSPALCWLVVAIGAAVALGFGSLASQNISQLINKSPEYQPTWFIFISMTSLIAVVIGTVLGNIVFAHNMQPYYALQNLNIYNYVDPTRMRGQQMMDAGRVQFIEGAVVNRDLAYAFQNVDTYCVAPITVYNQALGHPVPLSSYDYWAVGVNCCNGNSTQDVDFRCGPVDGNAHQGIRLMKDEQRAFFRLAVQQTEAAHHIKSVHPLFFYWTEDAEATMSGYLHTAFKRYATSMCAFFAIQLFMVTILSIYLSKMGHGEL